ncbi:MAG: peptidase M41, partial [Alistipes sp.]|nr:peptidase M41 [Alistipes sp.]
LIKVTIIPRGKALGAAWYLPEERQITTREQLMDELAATLGGRVSEQLTFGELSTGALNDLERATKQAYAMVAYYGMSEQVGTVSFYDSTGQSDMALTKPYSEFTAQQIDTEARRMIERAYAMAEKVLREHAAGVKELAELLLDREVVFTEDVERIFGKRKKDIERERREAEKAAADAKPSGRKPRKTDKPADRAEAPKKAAPRRKAAPKSAAVPAAGEPEAAPAPRRGRRPRPAAPKEKQ